MRISQSLKFTILDYTKQFWLQFQWQFSDFIQEKSRTVSNLKSPQVFAVRTGERPFLMTEKLTFYKIRRQGRTINFDQCPIFSFTEAVSGLATNSLPVPVSPKTNTVVSLSAICSAL
jgi:hypothetical protein